MAVPLQVNQAYTPGFSAGDLPEMQKIAQAFMAEMVPEPGVSPTPSAFPAQGYAYITGTPLLVQWGTNDATSTPGGVATITFLVPFSQAVFTFQVTPWGTAAASADAKLYSSSLTGCVYVTYLAGVQTAHLATWLAIGI